MPLQVGGDVIGAVYVGASPISEGWLWDGAAWSQVYSSAPPFGDGRLVKAGNQTFPASTWTRVRGWDVEGLVTADDDGVRVPEGVSVTVSAVMQFDGSGTYNTTQQFRLMLGDVALATVNRPWTNSGIVSTTQSFVGTGELVTMEAYCNQASNNRNVVRATETTLAVALA